MKHCIIFKLKKGNVFTESDYSEIKKLFTGLTESVGFYSVDIRKNCIARENRFDGMIVIDMEPGRLDFYDNSPQHILWKEKYGPLIEKKAIFDYQ